MHGNRVAPDEETPEVDRAEVVQAGVEAGQLANVVADHVQKTLGHVFFGELWQGREDTDMGNKAHCSAEKDLQKDHIRTLQSGWGAQTKIS